MQGKASFERCKGNLLVLVYSKNILKSIIAQIPLSHSHVLKESTPGCVAVSEFVKHLATLRKPNHLKMLLKYFFPSPRQSSPLRNMILSSFLQCTVLGEAGKTLKVEGWEGTGSSFYKAIQRHFQIKHHLSVKI